MIRTGCLGLALLAAVLGPLGCENERDEDETGPWTGLSVPYKAIKGDTPTSLAERAYGKRWMAFLIAEENEFALQEDGAFKEGATLRIPPDLRGRSVDPRDLAPGPFLVEPEEGKTP